MSATTVPAPSRVSDRALPIGEAAAQDASEVLRLVGTAATGLSSRAAVDRLARYGPNAVTSHRTRLLPVLWRQVRSPLLGLLLAAATASYFVGQRSDAIIIVVIVAMSVGLGFVNEYRAAKAAKALHSRLSHQALVLRDGRESSISVTGLVPGDVVDLHLGEVVPADIRLLDAAELEWDMRFIRRFMLCFGPLSSLFDFLTFAILLLVLHAGPDEFRSGWFVESLATQSLIIFSIRTRRVPFFRSHPSLPVTLATLAVVTIGALLPATPLARTLGFAPLPLGYFGALALLVAGYLVLVEVAKRLFRRHLDTGPMERGPARPHRHVRRRAARFSTT